MRCEGEEEGTSFVQENSMTFPFSGSSIKRPVPSRSVGMSEVWKSFCLLSGSTHCGQVQLSRRKTVSKVRVLPSMVTAMCLEGLPSSSWPTLLFSSRSCSSCEESAVVVVVFSAAKDAMMDARRKSSSGVWGCAGCAADRALHQNCLFDNALDDALLL